MFANTPEPPYVAVIFTTRRSDEHAPEYAATDEAMERLAATHPGFLGLEHAHSEGGIGITVSYFRDVDSARAWKQNSEHLAAQRLGREKFYAAYRVRVATVEREYGFVRGAE